MQPPFQISVNLLSSRVCSFLLLISFRKTYFIPELCHLLKLKRELNLFGIVTQPSALTLLFGILTQLSTLTLLFGIAKQLRTPTHSIVWYCDTTSVHSLTLLFDIVNQLSKPTHSIVWYCDPTQQTH